MRYFFDRYGQFGGFVPFTMTHLRSDPSEAAKETEIQLLADINGQNIETYRAELGHLLALKDRFAFALECCKRPSQQFRRLFWIEDDGSVEMEEKWADVETVVKEHRM